MPRYHHEATETRWPYELHMLLAVLMQEINAMREELGMPLRTGQEIRQAIRTYEQTHPRQGGG